MYNMLQVGEAVAARRRSLGLRQRDVARRAGVSREGLSRLENGRLREFGSGRLLAVLEVLGMELALVERPPGHFWGPN